MPILFYEDSFSGHDCLRWCFHSDVVSFSAIFVWCAFQTGNSVQVHIVILAYA